MKERVYHGSNKSGLTELIPFESTQKGAYVYATPSDVLAAIFSMRPGSILMAIGTEKDRNGNLIYSICERKPGIYEQYYNGAGTIYELDPTNFNYFSEHSWGNNEVRASGKQKVIDYYDVPSIYEKLKEFEQQGLLKIYHYPEKLNYMALDNSDLVQQAMKLYLMGGRKINRLDQFKNYYPEFSDLIDLIIKKTNDYTDKELEQFIKEIYDSEKKELNYNLINSDEPSLK